MNCKLTKEDCSEIYDALGLAQARLVQLRIGDHGDQLGKGWTTLSRGDSQTIFRALTDKRERLFQGAFDSHPDEWREPDSVTFRMAEHIERILADIGHLGDNLTAQSPDSSRVENPDAVIEELRASLRASLLDTTTGSTGRENGFSLAATQKPDSQSWSRRLLAFISSCLRLKAAPSAE